MAADDPRLRVDEHLRLDGVVAMFLATSLALPIEAVGLLIAVDWFTGIFRTFLNVNGDTILAMLVAKPTNEIDVDVYRGRKTVESERVDLEAMEESFAKADAAD
ncbi:MAG TPA: cation:dicarboxylase symporter family transporter [Microbacterium sp.]|nr:cation:dicarboxylase symporter family transporter [Microbacterium sp.]